jgi:hypothetical protein
VPDPVRVVSLLPSATEIVCALEHLERYRGAARRVDASLGVHPLGT